MTKTTKADPFWRCAAPKCHGKHLDGSPYCAKHQKANSIEQSVESGGLGGWWALLPAAGALWSLYYAYQLIPESCGHLAFHFSSFLTRPFSCVDDTAVTDGFAWLSPLSATFVGSCLVAVGLALALAAAAFVSPFWRRDEG